MEVGGKFESENSLTSGLQCNSLKEALLYILNHTELDEGLEI